MHDTNTMQGSRDRSTSPRIGAFFCSLMFGACALLPAYSAPPKTQLLSVEVRADADANQGFPTALDLVFVYDEAALERLPHTSAQWFERRNVLLGELGKSVKIVALEIAPASTVTPSLPSAGKPAIAVLGYTNYQGEASQTKSTLTGFRSVRIRLAADRLDYKGTP